MIKPGECVHPGCDRQGYGNHGYCPAHYQRKWKGQDMDKPFRKMKKTARVGNCDIEGCDNPHWAKGYCSSHYSRKRLGQDLEAPLRPKVDHPRCSVPECARENSKAEFCRKHTHVARTYNLSAGEIYELFKNPCAICSSWENPSVDHDHTCCPGDKSCGNCVRGVLCHSCNVALGLFKDDPERLENAAAYLRRVA